MFSLIVALLTACCKDEQRIEAIAELIAYSADSKYVEDTDTLRGSTSFRATMLAVIAMQQTSPITSCYAYSCEMLSFENGIKPSSISFSLDKALYSVTDTIPPHENLIGRKGITGGKSEYDIYYVEITLSDSFLNTFQLDSSYYTFELTGVTTDGINLHASKKMFVAI